jgi:molecular chaperone DnaJ
VLRLPGMGLPPLRGRGRGDQHVVVELLVPLDLEDDEQELARRLDESLGARESATSRGTD